jgi:hypothetical protein
MSHVEMRKVRKGLVHLFKTETKARMNEFKPRSNDWEEWMVFEGACEEA